MYLNKFWTKRIMLLYFHTECDKYKGYIVGKLTSSKDNNDNSYSYRVYVGSKLKHRFEDFDSCNKWLINHLKDVRYKKYTEFVKYKITVYSTDNRFIESVKTAFSFVNLAVKVLVFNRFTTTFNNKDLSMINPITWGPFDRTQIDIS